MKTMIGEEIVRVSRLIEEAIEQKVADKIKAKRYEMVLKNLRNARDSLEDAQALCPGS